MIFISSDKLKSVLAVKKLNLVVFFVENKSYLQLLFCALVFI